MSGLFNKAGEFEGVRPLIRCTGLPRIAPETKTAALLGGCVFRVRCGARTHDNQNHNLVLYQLN